MRSALLVPLALVMFFMTAHAQTARTVISSGGGKNFTVGQTFVSFTKGNPNSLWQGFWVPTGVPTGVRDFTPLVNFVRVFPNPATTQFSVESPSGIETLSIFDSRGNFVKSSNDKTVMVNDLATGIYSVQIKTSDNKTENHRLIIYR